MVSMKASISKIAGVMPRFSMPRIGRKALTTSAMVMGLSGALFSPAGLSGCVTKGEEYSCLNDEGPQLPTVTDPKTPYEYNNPNRPPYLWDVVGIANCDRTSDGMLIEPEYGEVIKTTIVDEGDGKSSITATIAYRFDDASRPDKIKVKITSKNGMSRNDIVLWPPIESTEGTCYHNSIKAPSSVTAVPDDPIVEGSGTMLTWGEGKIFSDCNGKPLAKIHYTNHDQFLNNATINFTGASLVVTGQVIPGVEGEAMRFELEDEDGNRKIVDFYLPTRKALKFESPDNYWEQYQLTSFYLLEAVADALAYRLVADTPDGEQEFPWQSTRFFNYNPTGFGPYTMKGEVRTYSSDILSATKTIPVQKAGEDYCGSIPPVLSAVCTPNEVVKGSDTLINCEAQGLIDCFGGSLSINMSETMGYLSAAMSNGVVALNGNTLTLDGRLLPSKDSVILRVVVEDNYGHTDSVYFYPTIKPFQLGTASGYIQVAQLTNFFASPAPTNGSLANPFNFGVILPGQQNPDPASIFDLPTASYDYTPTVMGAHTLNLNFTAYNNDVLNATLPFVANEGAGVSPCSNIPAPGLKTTSPLIPSVPRGDNTLFTLEMHDLTDCYAEALNQPYANNVAALLYNSNLVYDPNTKKLTITGRIRSDVSGGSAIYVSFADNYGNTRMFEKYLPGVTENQFMIWDSYPQQSEDLDVSLLVDPNGVPFNGTFTRPDNSVYNWGPAGSSFHTILSANKNQIGAYNGVFTITGGDGLPIPVPFSFPVNSD